MTRINTVPPTTLSTKHLQAEYFELPRVLTALEKKSQYELARIGEGKDIPAKYCMGKGHVTFFYNKLDYLYKRYNEIARVLVETRNVRVDTDIVAQFEKRLLKFPRSLMISKYVPSPDDMYTNMARLVVRHGDTKPELRKQLLDDLK